MKRRRVFIIAIVLVLAGAVGFVLWQRHVDQRATYQGKHARDWAVQYYASPDAAKRAEAAEALNALGPEAIPALRDMMRKREPFYMNFAVKVGRKMPLSIRRWFSQKLRPGRSYSMRMAAANALGQFGTNAIRALPELEKDLLDSQPTFRWSAARTLATFGTSALPLLLRASTNADDGVRHAAIYALGQIGPDALVATPVFLDAIAETNRAIQSAALYSIGRMGQEALPIVFNRMTNDPSQLDASLEALLAVWPGARPTLPIVVSTSTNDYAPLRRLVIESLSQAKVYQTNAMNLYAAGLRDRDVTVRVAAVRALSESPKDSTPSLPLMTILMKSTDPRLREAIAAAMGNYGLAASNALPNLEALLQDENEPVREAARRSLEQIAAAAQQLGRRE